MSSWNPLRWPAGVQLACALAWLVLFPLALAAARRLSVRRTQADEGAPPFALGLRPFGSMGDTVWLWLGPVVLLALMAVLQWWRG